MIIGVTGAGGHLGAAITLDLASFGATVIAMGRTVERLEAVAERAQDVQVCVHVEKLTGIVKISWQMAQRTDSSSLRCSSSGHASGSSSSRSPASTPNVIVPPRDARAPTETRDLARSALRPMTSREARESRESQRRASES